MTSITPQNVELSQDAIEYFGLPEEIFNLFLQIGKDPSKYKLGSICKRDHNFNGLGYSIRLKSNNSCVCCQREYDSKRIILNTAKRSATRRDYQQKNKKRLNQISRDYYKVNKERLNEANKNRYQENRDILLPKIRASSKKHYQENKEYYQQRNTDHYQNNKELYSIKSSKRDAIKKAATIEDFTAKDIRELIKKFNCTCAYCGVKISKIQDVKTHLDHVVPLSKGGKHSITNLVPSCASCNLSKFYHLVSDWYPKQSFYNILMYQKILTHIGDAETLNEIRGKLT